eukprot:7327285-Karenia_brevis.AAC.1
MLHEDRVAHNRAVNALIAKQNRLNGRSARAAHLPAVRVPCPLLPPADPEKFRELLEEKDIAPPIAPRDTGYACTLLLQPWN